MGQFTTEITIDAPVEAVWKVLADIGAIDAWNPGVEHSHVTSYQAQGVGACRRCELGGKNFLDEEVVRWEPNQHLTMRITDTNMPFEHADIHFELQPTGEARTQVTLTPEYKLKFGPLGALLDRLYVQRTYQKGMDSLLAGLKEHLEAEEA